MYYKDDLLSKNISELEDIAKEVGADLSLSSDIEALVYDILEKQAMAEATKNPLTTKRKRTRIAKKDTDRVYSVNGKEGENFDLKKNKAAVEQVSLFKDEPEAPAAEVVEAPATEEPAPAPKRRGRKSKKELEAEKAAEEAKAEPQSEPATEENVAEVPEEASNEAPVEDVPMEADAVPEEAVEAESVPEQEFAMGAEDEANRQENSDLIAQLQAKINAHNEGNDEQTEMIENGYWEGDPQDGTDFIPVVDLPIEDQGAVPNFDMFDNPTMPVMQAAPVYQASTAPAAAPQ